MGWFWATPSSVDDHHGRSDGEHGECQFLPSREWSQIQTDLCIGLTDELDEESKQSVERQQRPEHSAPVEVLFVNPPQDEEQQETFEKRFVEL
jgi:hypothetical protein